MKYDCGCVNDTDPSGVLCSISKCEFHTKHITSPGTRGRDYYTLDPQLLNGDGIPQFYRYITQLRDGLSVEDFDYLRCGLGKSCLELGCGLGMYIPLFLQGNWRYMGVDDSPYACDWVQNIFYVPIINDTIENFPLGRTYHCVFAAHVLEHMNNAPATLRRFYNWTRERLYLIVPDDKDPVNPDHLWFFNRDSLTSLLLRTGFKNIRAKTVKVIEQENFIYCVAEK